MRKTSRENIEISDLVGSVLGVAFKNEEFSLGKWGVVDNWTQLLDGVLILIECEKSQKHPNTNVLKLFPYLEENPNAKIFLIHYFYPENKVSPNRLALCDYLGVKMQRDFGYRFQYLSLKCSKDEIASEIIRYKKVCYK